MEPESKMHRIVIKRSWKNIKSFIHGIWALLIWGEAVMNLRISPSGTTTKPPETKTPTGPWWYRKKRTLSQEDNARMNKAFEHMDNAFIKMDGVFEEVDKIFKR
jgi:hypothetical protein